MTSEQLAAILADLDAAELALAAARAKISALEAPGAPAATTPPPAPAPPAPAPPQAARQTLPNPGAFFAEVRKGLGGLTQSQVDHINTILGACLAAGLPPAWAAYVLATPCLETGATFDPAKVESLNYRADVLATKFGRHRISLEDAKRLGRTVLHKADQQAIANTIYGGEWGRLNLGNTEPGDGWDFRGRSWPQATGRRNYQKIDDALGLGGALMKNPDLIFQPELAAPALVRAMVEGWYTGKSLRNFLLRTSDLGSFEHARAIINPGDRETDVAKFAMVFQRGLIAAGCK